MFIKFVVNIADYNSFSQQSTEYVAILYCYSLHPISLFWCHVFILRYLLIIIFVLVKFYLIRINFLHATKHFKHLTNRDFKETRHKLSTLHTVRSVTPCLQQLIYNFALYRNVCIPLNMLWNIFFPILGDSNCNFV